ncbi:MAG: hybrid sensor histidine kinase/response regulator [Desulfobacterales bacterium]|nr:hybrid sensor histidine kinase/response regulator [Desulfobacterales bacterium]
MKPTSILCVDDNPDNLRVLLEHLNDAGLKLIIAEDGETAIRRANYAIPDIILLDIMMPVMDGFQTCARLKENPLTKHIPIIFMSALSETVNKLKGFEVGAVDYITKPFQREEVLARINAHLTIVRQRQELFELNATKDRFFSIVAHDMRNIFNRIMGFAQLSKVWADKGSDDKQKHYSKSLMNAVTEAHQLMENLQQWATSQRGMISFELKFFMLESAVKKAIDYYFEPAKQKEVQIINNINSDMNVYADQNMIETILRNLISNAVKFSPKGGKVVVSSKELDNEIEVLVSDNGIGIKDDVLSRLFAIDRKYKEKGTANEPGTGLGLVLCRELMEKHNGRIFAESKLNIGTTIGFALKKNL